MTAVSPVQMISTVGAAGFVSGIQTGAIGAYEVQAGFEAIGHALDRYVGSAPSRDHPRELHSMIRGLPKGDIPSDVQGSVLSLIVTNQDVVDKAVRIDVINAEAPFDLGAEWRWIPAGEFLMGSAEDDPHRRNYEKLLQAAVTGGFFMLDHPVTNAEFLAFLRATGRDDGRDFPWKFFRDLMPTVKILHEEATAYSLWLGDKIAADRKLPVLGRLPSEEEWEKAAKGPDGNEFVSPATSEQAHFDAEAPRVIDDPDAYANGYGLKDIIGNVNEWTLSPWKEGSSYVVHRGTSWFGYFPTERRAADRGCCPPGRRSSVLGFRPVLVPAMSE